MFSIFFESLKTKSTQVLRPQKGNSGVSFSDTLINFRLCSSWKERPLFVLCLYSVCTLFVLCLCTVQPSTGEFL